MEHLFVRIFDVDFYMCPPVKNLDVTFSQFRGTSVQQVPVIRIFGSRQNGKKICVHIHGIFPYFYIPYDGTEAVNGLMYKIASNIDKAVNISLGQASSATQHVYKISLVSGVPFYGYHSKKHQFFKVYIYNPILLKRINNLLFNDAVLGKLYQPHETHLNFTLQFMIDYNLHGMSNIILAQVKYRNKLEMIGSEAENDEAPDKVSSCELECDTMGEHILNRQEIESGNLAANPGIAALWEDEKQRRRNKDEDSQLPHYLSLDKTNIPPTESHELFKRALQEKLLLLSQDEGRDELNTTVYPAECPRNKRFANCSFVDFHSPQNSQSNVSFDSQMDQTSLNDTLNLTLDQDVQDLVNVLTDLEKNVSVEEDSILSQVSRVEAENLDEDLDMSISLEASSNLLDETIKISQICGEENTEIDDSEVVLIDRQDELRKSLKIPQLDGNCQDFDTFSSLHTLEDFGTARTKVSMKISEGKINNSHLPNVDNQFTREQLIHNILSNMEKQVFINENRKDIFVKGVIPSKTEISENTKGNNEIITELKKLLNSLSNTEKQHISTENENTVGRPKNNVLKSNTDNLSVKYQLYQPQLILPKLELSLQYKNEDEKRNTNPYVTKETYETHIFQPKVMLQNLDIPSDDFSNPINQMKLHKYINEAEKMQRKAARNPPCNKFYETVAIDDRIMTLKMSENESPEYLLNKVHSYFCGDSIGERVFKKNKSKRNKVLLKTRLQYCRDVIVVVRNLHLPKISVKKRDMPSLTSDSFSCDESQRISKKPLKKFVTGTVLNQFSSKKPQKTIKRRRFEVKKERKNRNCTKIYRYAQKLSERRQECFRMLDSGMRPVFKIIPGYRPYIFKEKPRCPRKDSSTELVVQSEDPLKTPATPPPLLIAFNKLIEAQRKNETRFFDSVNSIMENYSISETKLLEYKVDRDENQCKDVLELKKRMLCLDGANDSSSDDESNNAKRSRRYRKSKPVYTSLPISKKSSVCSNSGIPTPITDHTTSKIQANDDPVNHLPTNSVISDNIQKIKRKISFENKSQDNTIFEEKLACSIIPRQPVNIVNHTFGINEPATKNLFEDGEIKSQSNIEPNVSKILDNAQDIEVEEKHENTVHLISRSESTPDGQSVGEDYISTSALYDIIHDYQPQEGTSKCYPNKILSPRSPESSKYFSSNENDLGLRTPEHYYDKRSSEEDSRDKSNDEETTKVNEEYIQSSGTSSDIFCGQKERSQGDLKEKSFSNQVIYHKPQFRPPTRRDIEQSLNSFNIPRVVAQEPFYSVPEDATGVLEFGYNILKIKTLTSLDAPEFESTFSGIEDFRRKHFPKTKAKSNQNIGENPRYSYCKERNCIITPLKRPPSRKDIINWLKENSVKPDATTKPEPKRNKIYLRTSQDGCSDDSFDLSLTLTPLTPRTDTSPPRTPEISTRSSGSKESLDTDTTLTPKSSRSREVSPIITRRKRKKKINRSIVLRKSALSSYSSENSGVISGVTLNNTYGFNHSVQNYQNARASVEHEYLTILAMELHVNTRGDFKPNPEYDSIQAIFFSIFNDVEETANKPRKCEGLFAISPLSNQGTCSFLDSSATSCDITYVENELQLFKAFTKFVIDWDPDILIGYEIQMLSWGYLIERCFHSGINIIPELSRVKDKHLKFNDKESGDLRVTGRVVLDFWRLLRHEIALQSYTLQSTVYEILQIRIPKYSFKELTYWWEHHTNLLRHRTVNYYLTYVRSVLKLLDQLDFVGRTSELARLFGIQFYEVLSRGSQFRVESMMLRLAKPMNYVAVSPSVQQRAKMKAPEYIALVLEPESKLYTDPVIVLDFQSLYPSIIIAYNYCFSTCVGRVELLGKNSPFEFGATSLKVSKERIKFLQRKNFLNFSPCGVAFVKKSVRDGIMPRMLREILDTRLMVKKSMKENKDDVVLQKVLHNRQLGLKLIANVTYGYTAANFSGRMPSVELGDSIVSKARETLQRAIALVDNNKEWGVRVVYGDTDSLFVHCPGKSRDEAFAIGEQIVEAVGKENPDPVKLKLEKVYQPCILQTKKRYVGYMYESPDQKEPVYDAKGIETVRRDGCPAVSKMLEKCLRLLFETKDVSQVKKFCVKQFHKIISGRISIQDLTFAKEFRGLTGYRPGACVPSLELAKRWVAADKRAEPRRGERVPYVIVNGPPGLPLIRLVRSPYELLNDPALKPNALYYITRVIIPPLNRCFNLIGADLHHWFHKMPRKQLQYLPTTTSPTKKSTISQYFISTLCAVCGTQTQNGLCQDCAKRPQETVVILNEKIRRWEASYNNCRLICSTCTQILDDPKCISLDCPVLYRLHRTNRDMQQADYIRQLISQNFDIF